VVPDSSRGTGNRADVRPGARQGRRLQRSGSGAGRGGLRKYEEECRLADDAAAPLAFDDTFTLHDETYSLRLVCAHMIAEYARHNGHGDLLREAIDGTTGV